MVYPLIQEFKHVPPPGLIFVLFVQENGELHLHMPSTHFKPSEESHLILALQIPEIVATLNKIVLLILYKAIFLNYIS